MSGAKTAKRSAPSFQRLVAAVLGGYLLASAWVMFCGALSQPTAEGVLAGMQISFGIHVAAIIWSFSPVSIARVWMGLVVPAALLSVATWALMQWRS